MATKVVTTEVWTCDLDGAEAVATVYFSDGDAIKQIDLCEKHFKAYKNSVDQYRANSTKTSFGKPVKQTKTYIGASAATIKAWADSMGMAYNSKGRLPKAVIEAYDKEHGIVKS